MDKEFLFLKGEQFELAIITRLLQVFTEPIKISVSLRTYSPYLNRKTEIDILLITSFGVYCIEAKSPRNLLKGNIADDMWECQSGRYWNKMYNPYRQNLMHVRALRHSFRTLGMEPPPILGVICIPNRCIVESDAKNIYTIGSLINKMENDSVILEHKWNVKLVKKYCDKLAKINEMEPSLK